MMNPSPSLFAGPGLAAGSYLPAAGLVAFAVPAGAAHRYDRAGFGPARLARTAGDSGDPVDRLHGLRPGYAACLTDFRES